MLFVRRNCLSLVLPALGLLKIKKNSLKYTFLLL